MPKPSTAASTRTSIFSKPQAAASLSTTTTTTAGWTYFLSTAGVSKVSPLDRNPLRIYSKTIATALSRTSLPKLACSILVGGKPFASAITTTTASTISSSPTSEKTCCTTTTATAPSRTSAKKPASSETASAGTPAALSWTTIATATSISSSPTTSIST